MSPQTIDIAPLDRRAAVGAVHDDSRIVDLVFATSGPAADVLRFDWTTGKRYIERLSLDPRHVNLDRLRSYAPLLNSHSSDTLTDVIGVVEPDSVVLNAKDARASVRFSKRADVEPIFMDVRDGIVKAVSIGYRIAVFQESEAKDGTLIRTAVNWTPYEISMCPMGADAGAQTRGTKPADTNLCEIVRTVSPATADADLFLRARIARARCY